MYNYLDIFVHIGGSQMGTCLGEDAPNLGGNYEYKKISTL